MHQLIGIKWNKIAENMVNHDDQKIKIAMVGKIRNTCR